MRKVVIIGMLVGMSVTAGAFVPRGLTQPLRQVGMRWAKSTDWVEMQEQYLYNGDAWDATLMWLTHTDMRRLEPGTYYVSGDSIVAKVQEAKTREESRIEAHIRYADLQWTISGTERYEVYRPEDLKATDKYNASKDVQHFALKEGVDANKKKVRRVLLSDEKTVFLFFPDQPHKALLEADTTKGPEAIRKVVVKIPYVSGKLED